MLRLDRESYLSAFGSPSPVRGAAGEIGGVEVVSQYCSGNKILLPKVRSSQTKVSIATLVKQTKIINCLFICLATLDSREQTEDMRKDNRTLCYTTCIYTFLSLAPSPHVRMHR